MNLNHHLIGGRSNESPTTENGLNQGSLLGKRLKKEGVIFDEIYSSLALRTIHTAQIVAVLTGYPLDAIFTSSQLLEQDQGEWEGKPRDQIYTSETLARINTDNWNFTPPHGESQRTVEERMLYWVNETLLPKYMENLTIGIIGHGTAIKCMLRGIMDFSPSLTYKLVLDNASITRLKYSEKGWHPVTVNDTGHLLGKEMLS